MKLNFNHILCFCGAALIFSGCYRNDLAVIYNAIEDIGVNSVKSQVVRIDSTVDLLQDITTKLGPELEQLESSRQTLAERINEVKDQLRAVGGEDVYLQAQLIELQQTFDLMNSVYQIVAEADLKTRTEELEAFVASIEHKTDERATALETAFEAFATIEELSKLTASVEALQDLFGKDFDKKLSECMDLVSSWVSQSDVIRLLFVDFIEKSEVDCQLQILRNDDGFLADAAAELDEDSEQLKLKLEKTIEDAINGITKKLEEKIGAVKADLNAFCDRVDALVERVVALETMAVAVGDYLNYKGVLIDDIRALQAAVLDDGTLTSLVMSLKLVLADGEDSYYDIAEIVANLYNNIFNVRDHESRLSLAEDLASKRAAFDSLAALADDAVILGQQIAANKHNADSLVLVVDAFLEDWNKVVLDTLSAGNADIIGLQSGRDKLLLALGLDIEGSRTNSGIYKTLADLNTAIVNFKIGDMRDSLDVINNLLEKCGIDGVTGLQNCLENIDSRLQAIWDMIGKDETLQIGSTLIDAINKLNSKFGILDNSVAAIVNALKADLDILKGSGWTEGLDLVTLNSLAVDLRVAMDKCAQVSDVEVVGNTVKNIQETLLSMMTTQEFNDTLSYYILSYTADTTFATITALEGYIGAYEDLFGKGPEPAAGTVLARLAELESKTGDGQLTDGWISDLSSAVETLHSLVGDSTVVARAEDITKGIVDDLVKTLLGKDGDADDLAAWLATFHDEIEKFKNLSVNLGEDGSFTYDRIDDAIEAVYNKLSTYVTADNCEDSKGTFESMAKRFESIESVLGTDYFSAEYTIQNAVEQILALIGDLGEGNSAKKLTDSLSSLYDDLKDALVGDGDFTDSLSISSLKGRLDNLGFTDIKNSAGKTLSDALSELASGISGIRQIIGSGLAGSSFTECLRAMLDSVGTFSNAQYQAKISSFNDDIQALLNALSANEIGSIDDISGFVDRVNSIYYCLDTLLVNGNTALGDIVADLDRRIKVISDSIGNTPLPADMYLSEGTITEALSLFVEKFGSALGENIFSDIANFIDVFAGLLEEETDIAVSLFGKTKNDGIIFYRDHFYTLFRSYMLAAGDRYKQEALDAIVSQIEVQMSKLKTDSKDNFVNAINELLALLNETKEDNVSLDDISAKVAEILGEGGGKYSTLAALNVCLDSLNSRIGDKPSDWAPTDDIFGRTMALYQELSELVSTLGTNNTDYEYFWDAVADLQIKILGHLGAMINSMVFIPEYDDGKTTLATNASRTSFGDLEMSFLVNASTKFFERYGTQSRMVKGLITSNKTSERTISGTAVLSSDTLKVKFDYSEFTKVSRISPDEQLFFAVVLVDNGFDEFTSPFVQLYFEGDGQLKTPRIKAVSPSPESGHIVFAAGIDGGKAITLAPMNAGDDLADIQATVIGLNGKITVEGEKCNRSIISSQPTAGTATVSFSDGVTTFDYTVDVVNAWNSEYCHVTGAVNGSVTNNGFKAAANKTITITFDLDKLNAEGDLSVSQKDRNWVSSLSCTDNVITLKTEGWAYRPNAQDITIYCGGKTLAKIAATWDD